MCSSVANSDVSRGIGLVLNLFLDCGFLGYFYAHAAIYKKCFLHHVLQLKAVIFYVS